MRYDLAPLLTLLAEQGDYIYRPALTLSESAVLLDHVGHVTSVEHLRGESLEVKPLMDSYQGSWSRVDTLRSSYLDGWKLEPPRRRHNVPCSVPCSMP